MKMKKYHVLNTALLATACLLLVTPKSQLKVNASSSTSSRIAEFNESRNDENDADLLNFKIDNAVIDAYLLSFNETFESTFNNSSNMTSYLLSDSTNNIVRYFFVSFIYIPIIICTLVGNMLVVLAVVIVRKLHTQDNANNFLIVSLAISDFLVGVLAMPFAVYVELTDDNK